MFLMQYNKNTKSKDIKHSLRIKFRCRETDIHVKS